MRNNARTTSTRSKMARTVRVFRNGKPIAEIVPIRPGVPSWKRQASPLTIKGLSLSREILKDRDDSA
ncbi:MAG: prevent-host-death protein [Betaproteobacteria bacterium]|nr:prevent-host-death protein [Betaproteobacteria bacterium]